MDDLFLGVLVGAALPLVASSVTTLVRHLNLRRREGSGPSQGAAVMPPPETASVDGTVAIRVTDYANGVEHAIDGSRVGKDQFELEPGERVVIEITDTRGKGSIAASSPPGVQPTT